MRPDLAYLVRETGQGLALVTVRDGHIERFEIDRRKALHWMAELAIALRAMENER